RTVENRLKNDPGSLSTKCLLAGGHLIKHNAKRKQVRTGVQRLRANLFRRHVGHRTDRGSTVGQRVVARKGGCFMCSTRGSCRPIHLRQTKIEDLRLTAIGDEDIRGFDIPVNDSRGVGSIQSVGYLDTEVEKFVQRQRASPDALS